MFVWELKVWCDTHSIPVCKRGDDKSPRISEVLVAIEELCIDRADIQVFVLKPVVSATYIVYVAGHMVRMKDETLPKRSETKKQDGCGKRGRPQLRMEDCVKRDPRKAEKEEK